MTIQSALQLIYPADGFRLPTWKEGLCVIVVGNYLRWNDDERDYCPSQEQLLSDKWEVIKHARYWNK